jgi:divalent metal cation (Fe/Co/Zn/Cd) transporter
MHHANTLLRRGLLLEYITLGWNVVGTVIVIVAAIAAHSVALAGFGLDSLVEIGASTVVIWQLRGIHHKREQRALRLIAVAFFALAIYILGQSARTFWLGVHPSSSPSGMFWLALTLAAMLVLAAGKHTTGTALNNQVLKTAARVTLVDAYLAASVLLGLVFNALFGWWWADPLTGLVIVVYGVLEGSHAWNEASNAA